MYSDFTSPSRMKAERGISLLELAFFLPVLVLIVAGIVDYGFALREMQAIQSAAREGARLAASHARVNRSFTESGGVRTYNNLACVDPAAPFSSIQCGAKTTGLLTVQPSDPIVNAAKKAACSSINNAGFNGADWVVASTVPPPVFEDNSEFQLITVKIEKSPAASKCVICWDRLLTAFSAKSESTFVLEAPCN